MCTMCPTHLIPVVNHSILKPVFAPPLFHPPLQAAKRRKPLKSYHLRAVRAVEQVSGGSSGDVPAPSRHNQLLRNKRLN